MSYLSLQFAVFVLILWATHRVLGKHRWVVLLCGSLAFYALFDVRYMPFLLFTAGTTYYAAMLMERSGKRRRILVLCIAANALVWFAVKELPWAVSALSQAFSKTGSGSGILNFSVLVPVGISYFMIMAIGYLADVYKGKIAAEKNFGKYLLFLSWFPAIVQGPISRYDQLMPKLVAGRSLRYEDMRTQLILILIGLVKKMVIADRLGIFVNGCFDNFRDLQGIILYFAAVCYSIQLYMDFSGCVDICRGVSGLFGVELVSNFNRPYLSRSIKEFWGRWHISFSSWLKDYVYIPLGGNRKGQYRKYLNLLLTFLVSGLWHGAGFHFLVWGLIHGLYQIIGDCTAGLRRKMKKAFGIIPDTVSDKIYSTVITFHLVMFAWIFFRSDGVMSSLEYIRNMFSSLSVDLLISNPLYSIDMSSVKELAKSLLGIASRVAVVGLNVCVVFLMEICVPKQDDVVQGITRQHFIIRWGIYWLLIFDVLLFGVYGKGYNVSAFMYGGF